MFAMMRPAFRSKAERDNFFALLPSRRRGKSRRHSRKSEIGFNFMKKLLLALLSLSVLGLASCSKKEETTAVKPQSTPDAARLKSDSERLQQATANAAKEREKERQSALTSTPTPSPTP